MPVIFRNGRHFLVSREGLLPVQVLPGGVYKPLYAAEETSPEVIEKAVAKQEAAEIKELSLDIGSEMDKILARIKGSAAKK